MISPYQVAHPQYRIVEATIDGFLRAHEWSQHRGCLIHVQRAWHPDVLENLLANYRRTGWFVYYYTAEEIEAKSSNEMASFTELYGALPETYSTMYGFVLDASLVS